MSASPEITFYPTTVNSTRVYKENENVTRRLIDARYSIKSSSSVHTRTLKSFSLLQSIGLRYEKCTAI